MRMSWLVLPVSLMLLLFVGSVHAQEEVLDSPVVDSLVVDSLVLDSLIQAALKNNPELSAAAHARQSTGHAAKTAGALPDPSLSVGFMNLPANSLALDETPMSGVVFGLSQKIPWPGKLNARTDLANNREVESEANEQIVRNRIVREVTDAYLDYSYWSQSLKIVEEYLDLLDGTRDIAEVRYANGKGLAQDVLRAGSMVSRTEVRLLQAKQKRLSSLLRIRQTVGDTSISEALPSYLAEPRNESTESFSVETNPLLARAASGVRQAQSKLHLARQEYWPDLTLGVDYSFRKNIPGDPVHGADYLSFKVGVSLPLWFFAKQKHQVRASDQMVLASKQHERSVHNLLTAQYDDALSSLAVTLESLKKYDSSLIPEASAAVEAANVAYEVGQVDFNALLSAQSDAFEVQIERLGLLRQYHKTKAALTEITGGAFERNR